jgi:hypothetical protein
LQPKLLRFNFYCRRFKSNLREHATCIRKRALLQITTNGKLNPLLAKGAAYESLPWSAFSG